MLNELYEKRLKFREIQTAKREQDGYPRTYANEFPMEQTSDPRELQRAVAVRMRLKKYSREQVGELLNVGPDYVTKWTSMFKQEEVASLKIGHRILEQR